MARVSARWMPGQRAAPLKGSRRKASGPAAIAAPASADQIWFAEKNEARATIIYPLLDYSPRKNENLERGYLLGRYGAIPFVGDLRL